MAEAGKAETLNYEHVNVYDALQEMTQGRGSGPLHRCGRREAHAPGVEGDLRQGQADKCGWRATGRM